MTTTDPSTPGVLQPDDPNYRQFMAASQFEPEPIARQFAGMLVATCPREVRHDPVTCADHLQGVMAAHGITDLMDRGRRLAAPHLAAADEALDQLTAANLRLESAADRRRNLPDEVVDAPPIRAGRAAIRRQLAQNQHVAAQRELAGDLEHRQTGSPGRTGWVVAGIVAVIETVVTLRIFNVDLTDLTWTAVPWLALSGGLVLFNHQVAGYLGEKRRAARETRDAAIRLNTNGFHGFHELPGTARHIGQDAVGPGGVAGLAPSAAQVRHTRRAQWLALAIYGVPLGLLLAGIYLRMLSSTGRLMDLGAFGYVFPLIAAAVLASLLWALIVEPHSRGNALGDHLQSQQAVDIDTVERDEELLDQGRAAAAEARTQAADGRAALMSAEQEIAETAELAHRGLQIAHAALGIATIGHVRAENMIAQPFPHRDRIGRAIAAEELRTDSAAEALNGCAFPSIDTAESPHAVYATPPIVVPDLAFVNPGTLAPYAESTLALNPADDGVGDETRRGSRAAVVAGALAVLVLVAAATWYFFLKPTNDAAAVTTESRIAATDLTQGVDYDFITKAADGSPARWDCATTITVRRAGPAPAGADTALAEAVDASRSASNLPQPGTPLAWGSGDRYALAAVGCPAG